MGSSITGKEYPLVDIFSNAFEFHIPAYQRPYAWTEEETGELFDDLYDFYQAEKTENFFLGSIVLIKNENVARADIIDGQQRITTLTILFAVIIDYFSDPEDKEDVRNYIKSRGSRSAGIQAQPRLFLRDRDRDFFRKYIQEVRIKELEDLDRFDTEAQEHIHLNAKLLKERLEDAFGDNDNELMNFCQFIVNRCFLVSVSTPSQESAFRIFSVMNSRGLDLMPIDIIKSDTIGKLSDTERDEYTHKWEELENSTGRDGFNEVFTHTRTIFLKERQKKNLLEEFKAGVLSKTTPKELIDKYLMPYTEAYIDLKNCRFEASRHAEEINETLVWLNKINNYDWMPPAIKFFAEHSNDSEYLCWFITKLERLASYLLVTARDVNQRFERYKWILEEMDNRPDHSQKNPLRNIELTGSEKERFIRALDGEIYLMPAQRRNYIIQRLDSFVGCGGASYSIKKFSVEHVLPQNPGRDSEWFALWSDEQQRKYWLNRIANLVPLTRQRNSAAQNYDFSKKKEKYFQTKSGTSSYALTTQVLNTDTWTPEVVSARQKYLLDIFKKKWDLKINNDQTDEGIIFLLAGRGANASGHSAGQDAFVVRKGSRISADVTESMSAGYKEIRDSLVSEGIIVDGIFTDKYTFNSSSAAASVILGRAANGPREWVCLDGRSLNSIC